MENLLPELIRLLCYHVLEGALPFAPFLIESKACIPLSRFGIHWHAGCSYYHLNEEYVDTMNWDTCGWNAEECLKLVFCKRLEVLSQLNRHWRDHMPWESVMRYCLRIIITNSPFRHGHAYRFFAYPRFSGAEAYAWERVPVTPSIARALTLRFLHYKTFVSTGTCPFIHPIAQWRTKWIQRIKDGKRPDLYKEYATVVVGPAERQGRPPPKKRQRLEDTNK